jgi:hypothetical protein
MTCPGKAAFSFLTESIPSLFISGVPASIQSAPPSIASFAICIARSVSRTSRATWSIGLIKSPFYKLMYLVKDLMVNLHFPVFFINALRENIKPV